MKASTKEQIQTHISKISDDARADYSARRIDEVMTDALYRACGADSKAEMNTALETAIRLCQNTQTKNKMKSRLQRRQ